MREILFKAKTIDGKRWVQGYFIAKPILERYFIIQDEAQWEIDMNTLCQYTGLTDKNGNMIWENDIVKYHFGEDTAIIRYGKYQNCFDSMKACHVGFFVDWQDYKRKDLGYWVEMIDCNVIGNVFDNADLVKG